MTIIGYKRNNFSGTDGTPVTGYNIYCTYPLAGDDTAGSACDRIYLTDDKLAKSGYVPKVGDEVNVTYNRYGKPAAIIPVHH